MSKTHQFNVVSAFVHEGKIRTPKSTVTLSERDAKPLLERGKVTLAKGEAKGAAAAKGKKAEGEPAGGED
ncbi:hypothetical protein T8T21_05635 [Limimaricola variabilis]|uniref:hypothetical protein n=1 Tax=Limimaricola variabilis TaxID=1492771 RepID=UPI002AC9C4C0|nr:hypothetical protein [Limimaricola variabilis]WPY95604.1 hypothetical protein T8T21_05635 [Limimaricola variabilis]